MPDSIANGVRSALRQLVETYPGGVTARALDEFGWFELHREHPATAVGVLFEEVGRSAAIVAGLDVLATALLSAPTTAKDLVTLVVAEPASEAPCGTAGYILGPHQPTGRQLVLDISARRAWIVGSIPTPDSATAVLGIDPNAQLRRVSLAPASDSVLLGADVTSDLIDGIRRAIAYQQLGHAAAMLNVARQHVSVRFQFGRPIGSNQSVQHRLADVYVAIAAARAALDVTWDDKRSIATSVAYVLAATAVDTATRGCMQVCGGMGFTEEFELARMIRRSLILMGIFGSGDALQRDIGAGIIGGASVPRLGRFDVGGEA
jgi:Acyl-CoA dehydrogenase, C-terminal domain